MKKWWPRTESYPLSLLKLPNAIVCVTSLCVGTVTGHVDTSSNPYFFIFLYTHIYILSVCTPSTLAIYPPTAYSAFCTLCAFHSNNYTYVIIIYNKTHKTGKLPCLSTLSPHTYVRTSVYQNINGEYILPQYTKG